MSSKLYYTAMEIAKLPDVSRTKAYDICRELNEELEEEGYIVIPGKLPKKYLEERIYGLVG